MNSDPFKRIFDFLVSHWQRLRGFIFKRLGARDGADDLLHDLVIKMVNVADSIRDFSNEALFSFACTTLKRLAINRNERRKREQKAVESLGYIVNTEQADRDSHDPKKPDLFGAIRKLSARDQYLITSLYFAEESYEEIAKGLGISSDAAYMASHRARQRLRQLIEHDVSCDDD